MSLLPIYNAVLKEAPDYNADKIYETLHGVMLSNEKFVRLILIAFHILISEVCENGL